MSRHKGHIYVVCSELNLADDFPSFDLNGNGTEESNFEQPDKKLGGNSHCFLLQGHLRLILY